MKFKTPFPQVALSRPFVDGVAMSLCWYSAAHESPISFKVTLLLALHEFLFEDLPRYGRLLSIWASAGAVWFLWLDYLCCTRYRC
jgi:hypothetical protein